MPNRPQKITYPRRRLIRFLLKTFLRFVLTVLFRIEIVGKENFPRKGPLLVVGNHTGAMEVVLLNAFVPWQIEMLSAADMPVERITEIIDSLYRSIPINRGTYDRKALATSLHVLGQNGIVGLFPEGGVWDIGKQKALPGISWLSYRSGAPILPIGFNNTAGAMDAGLKFKRPTLKMYVGKVLPAAEIPPGTAKKIYFQEHAAEVMEVVYSLVSVEIAAQSEDISDESFEMEINLTSNKGDSIELPSELKPQHSYQLARFLHLPLILELFIINLELPVEPLSDLKKKTSPEDLIKAVRSILDYLEKDNPHLLTYRFGIPAGLSMQEGIKELLSILEWCSDRGHEITVTPVRRYYSKMEKKEIIQREQKIIESWM
jgi:1-acyl-sn-glycerol-3-phosphate acyltransferase